VGGQEGGGEGGGGWGGWRGRAGGLTMHSDTGDQAVCAVGQEDGHSNHDHTMRRVDVEWNRLGPHATLLKTPVAPQGL